VPPSIAVKNMLFSSPRRAITSHHIAGWLQTWQELKKARASSRHSPINSTEQQQQRQRQRKILTMVRYKQPGQRRQSAGSSAAAGAGAVVGRSRRSSVGTSSSRGRPKEAPVRKKRRFRPGTIRYRVHPSIHPTRSIRFLFLLFLVLDAYCR
jgi:hypothetical protein